MITYLRRRYFQLSRWPSKKIIAIIIFYTALITWGILEFTEPDAITTDYYTEGTTKSRNVLERIEKPTIIYWTEKIWYGRMECDEKCDILFGKIMLPPDAEGAYLFYASRIEFSDLPLPRNPRKVIWGLSHEESPRNVIELSHEKMLNLFNYSTTYSRYSDVPFPLQNINSLKNITSKKYYVETMLKNLHLGQLSPILYLQSDCDTSTERDKYVKKFKLYQRIDSYGKCVHNKNLPPGLKTTEEDYLNSLNDENFLKFVAQYKFVLAIENGVCNDYITEKFWRAIHVGVVPIYFGSPTIRDWLPNPKSAILIEDFPEVDDLSGHIDYLLQHDDKYEEYLEHKTKGLITNQNLINELRLRPYQTDVQKRTEKFICFVCDKLHDKNKKPQVVNTSHYNCPKPISALTQKSELDNSWVTSWKFAKRYANFFYNKVMKN